MWKTFKQLTNFVIVWGGNFPPKGPEKNTAAATSITEEHVWSLIVLAPGLICMLANGVHFWTPDIIWLEKQNASFIVKYWVLLRLCDYLSHSNSKNAVVVNKFVGGLNEIFLSIWWKFHSSNKHSCKHSNFSSWNDIHVCISWLVDGLHSMLGIKYVDSSTNYGLQNYWIHWII